GMGEFGIHERLVSEGRAPKISAEEFKKQQSTLFIENLKSITEPQEILRPGYMDLVNACLEASVPFHIVSNTAKDAVMAGLIVTKLKDIIPDANIITFDDIHALGLNKKPHADPYLLAM